MACVSALAGELEWNGHIEAGVAAYRRSDYPAAIARFQDALTDAEAFGDGDPRYATTLNDLAEAYKAQGRLAEAEPLYRRSLAIREKILGPEHPDVAGALNNLAGLYRLQGLYANAEPLLRRALAIREKSLGPEHGDVAQSLNNLAALYGAEQRYADAEPLYERALAMREKILGPEHPGVAATLNNLAAVYEARGRFADAEPLYRRALAIWEKTLGPEHPDVATGLNNLAGLYVKEMRLAEGLDTARRATAILRQRYTRPRPDERRGALAEQRSRSSAFERHVALLAADALQRPATGAPHAAESFDVAQLARASDTAGQVARMAARLAAGSDALARAVRQRQDLLAMAESLDTGLVQDAAKPPAARNAGREQLMRDQQAILRRAVAALDARLEREFPKFYELADARPVALEAAQELLGEGEALVVFLVSREESFVWAVVRGNAMFRRLAIKRSELDVLVRKLRSQLDLGAGDPDVILAKPFDVAAANELYIKLLSPVEPVLAAARRLIVVPDGALQSLPPGVLVTELPAKPLKELVDHVRVAWLAKKYSITVLPSVSSLRALRTFAGPSSAPEPLGGFGDPILEGPAGGTRGVTPVSRGALADVNEVRKLQPLPESADELRAIAATLHAPESALYLGAAATETQVKRLDLSRYRNLAFATHGLVAGAFEGQYEPALVLTPPAQATDLDDGLLSASEIALLKLNADWVVLSACNTAAADGTPGAEGLSGLAKAFFFAGARSLLVSHWSVSSEAAKALTTGMFEETAKGAGKAEALQRSMLSLMQRKDKPYFAHPALWAPFVVVGEGN